MPHALSNDIRHRLVECVAEGLSRRKAAIRLKTAASTAVKVLKRWNETGSVEPKSRGGFRRSKLKPHRDFILAIVGERPDITMPELAGELLQSTGVSINPSNLSKFLIGCGLSFKKTLRASEQDRPELAKERSGWRDGRQPVMRRQQARLIFVDETSTNTKMTRLR